MARRHGVTANTYKRFFIDSGAVYIDYTSMAVPGTLIGATRGGSQFTIEQEIREMEVDGARGPVKGGRRITMVKPILTVNLLEHTLVNLKRALVGSSSATYEVSWDEITRSLSMGDTDFEDNIVILGEVSGEATNGVGLKVDNVIVDSNFEVSFADKEEGVIAMTFTGHFTPANLGAGTDTEPWSIILPTES